MEDFEFDEFYKGNFNELEYKDQNRMRTIEFFNKNNVKNIIDILKDTVENKSIINENTDSQIRKQLRDELIDFFKYFDVENCGFISGIHLRKMLVNILDYLNDEQFEDIFFQSEIEGGGFIDYQGLAYSLIPEIQDN